jgi:hypothetical protein
MGRKYSPRPGWWSGCVCAMIAHDGVGRVVRKCCEAGLCIAKTPSALLRRPLATGSGGGSRKIDHPEISGVISIVIDGIESARRQR